MKRRGQISGVALAMMVAAGAFCLGQGTRPAAKVVDYSFDSPSDAYAALVSPEWSERDAAQRFLMTQRPDERATVEKMLVKSSDPEAIARLYAVAIHLYLKEQTPFSGETGLLGITLQLQTSVISDENKKPQSGIGITYLNPGFPSAEVLRVGDTVIGLNGTRFADDITLPEFQAAVMVNKPGTSVKLTIDRAGVIKDVRVKLAGVADPGLSALQEFVEKRNAMADVYRQQLQQMRGTLPTGQVQLQPIPTPLPPIRHGPIPMPVQPVVPMQQRVE